MKLKSIQLKIALIAGICLIIVAGSVVGYNLISSTKVQNFTIKNAAESEEKIALEGLKTLAGEQAGIIKAELEPALNAARTMANTFEIAKDNAAKGGKLDLGRDQINAILLKVLQKNPDFNGTYSCWEPNALDGQDSEFKTGKDGNNKDTGRFTPYWNRDSKGNIAVQALVEYDTLDKHPNGVLKGGWYIGPKETGVESVLDPIPYIVQGKQVWLATMSVPIIANGKFYGVAGADYDLSFVQKLTDATDENLFSGQGDVTIISYMGLVVADSARPDLIGQHIKNLIPEGWENILKTIQAGKSEVSIDSKGIANAFYPITFGNIGKPWAVMIRVPRDIILAEAYQLGDELHELHNTGIFWQSIVCLIITIVAIIILWLASGSIARPIREAAGMADKIREGDFDQRLTVKSKDEVGQLGTSLNEMADSLHKAVQVANKIADKDLDVEVVLASDHDQLGIALQKMTSNLNEVMGQVQSTGEKIASGAAQSSDASQSLSQATTESAASLEEITSSISQINSQTQQNSANAQQANQLATAARGSAATGGQRMEDMNSAMHDLNESADKIAKIIKVIDEIAFQTNLLALNAAVEAARAGTYGKGFAVVAEEVRNLAGRSAKAAKETAELLESNEELVNTANSIAKQTGEALNEIVDGITKAADLVAEIAAASKEQASGIAQIGEGLHQIESATQQNTANAEETASVSEQLSGQARILHNILSQFQLKLHGGGNRELTAITSAAVPRKSEQITSKKRPQLLMDKRPHNPKNAEINLDDDEFGKF